MPSNVLLTQLDLALRKRLDIVLDAAVAEHRVAGAVLLVARAGAVAYRRAVGFADVEARRPMTERTRFRLASMTKPIVSVAALALVERGKLGLDDAVTQWLPDFRPRLVDGREASISVRQLLTHTSGLSYDFWEPADGPQARAQVSSGIDQPGLSLEENLRRLSQVPLSFEPGTAWQYSLSTDVLGGVVAKAYGAGLPEAVRALVAEPLGVDLAFTVERHADLAKPYFLGPELAPMGEPQQVPFGASFIRFSPARAFDPASYPSGGAGLVARAEDYLRFLEALREGGARLLTPAITASMTANRVGDLHVELDNGVWGFGYGFAVLKQPAPGDPRHAGTFMWGGVYGNSFFVDPEAQLSVVLLTNTALVGMLGELPDAVARAVYGSR
jgi:CubicO group peptidase (beta-lactamase class C family)